ncbi:MAG: TonB-dependent receptor [Pedobacter sp.]|nr:TonB-dependent receptor [Pedobacter sp.]
MKKLLQSLFILLFVAVAAAAQDRTITGKVTGDSNGLPIPGVTVRVTGVVGGVVTGANGNYAIGITTGAKTLQFSSIGYITKAVTIGRSNQVNIVLQADANALEDVVVVGYGTTKKESFTGSAAVVKSDVLENRPVSSFDKALQGAAAGVTVTTTSGQPGAASEVRIRGIGSISANASPLYVIDGIPIQSGDFSQVATTSDILSTINPNDIASVTVLKDASAASIYGSRAANGVILITTKKGRSGKTRFNLTMNGGNSYIATNKPASLDASQYFKTYFDYYYNKNIAAGSAPDAAATKADASTIKILAVNPYNTATPYGAGGSLNPGAALFYDTNWRDAVTNTGVTKSVNLSAQGGNDATKFFFSGGYFDQKGIILASNFKRYSGKINLSNQVNKAISVGVNTTLSYTDQNTPAGATGAANPVRFGDVVSNVYSLYVRNANGVPIKDASGALVYNYKNPVTQDFNPVGLALADQYNTITTRAILNPYVEVRFLKDFVFKTNEAVDYINNRERQFYNRDHGNGAAPAGRADRYTVQDITVTFQNTLTYNKTFGLHALTVLLGQEAYRTKYDNVFAEVTGFPFAGAEELVAGSIPGAPSSYYTQKRLESYFSRANYSYNNKYFFEGSFRRDGSSVFGANNRYGNFYAVGGAWRLSQEDFVKNIAWINELKLRASYGTSGNDQIGRYDAQGLYALGNNYEGSSAISYSNLANPALKWEQNNQFDVGLEFSVLKNRISGEVSFYNRKADGLLYKKPLSFTTGFQDVTTNLASVKNTGVDVLLNGTPVETSNFRWDVSFNAGTSKNKILKLAGNDVVTGSKRLKVGSDIYQFYLREYAGVDQATGKPIWFIDELGADGKPTGKRITTDNYSAATRYDSGSALPKFTGGLTNTFKYKDFDFTAFLFFSSGGKIYDDLLSTISHAGRTNGTQFSTSVFDSWTPTNTNTNVPRFLPSNPDQGNSQSTRFLYDGSYIRMKNLTLGYNLNKNWAEKVKLANARIFVSAENAFTLSKHHGMDPEVSLSGVPNGDIPNVKTFSLGLNVGF